MEAPRFCVVVDDLELSANLNHGGWPMVGMCVEVWNAVVMVQGHSRETNGNTVRLHDYC